MGLRPNEPEWKHRVNELIRELQPEIQAILLDYGVPLLDERGNLMHAGTLDDGAHRRPCRSQPAIAWTSTGRRCPRRWPEPQCCRRRIWSN